MGESGAEFAEPTGTNLPMCLPDAIFLHLRRSLRGKKDSELLLSLFFRRSPPGTSNVNAWQKSMFLASVTPGGGTSDGQADAGVMHLGV